MNVLLVSPHFPPSYRHFARALSERGIGCLGLGDVPREHLPPDLAAHLRDWAFVPDLHRTGDAIAAARDLAARHGGVAVVESHNEHWLGLDATLREALGVAGPRAEEIARWQSKTAMGARFEEVGLDPPRSTPVRRAEDVRAFAQRFGLPVLLKPDVGVGASGVRTAATTEELERVLREPVEGTVVQELVRGELVSFDGLAGPGGEPLFTSSFRYAAGVHELVGERRDVVYHVRREVPEAVREVGLRALAAFDVRSRFFHVELFALPDGRVRPLEINVRPPGGWSLDLMDFAADVDLYRMWAATVAGAPPAAVLGPHRYFVAHVGRRAERRYRLSTADAAARLGPALCAVPEVPRFLGDVMGDPIFLIRHEDEAELSRLVADVLAPA